MSLLDDYSELESRLDQSALKAYFENIPKQDIPAYWQAWYDILYSKYSQFNNVEKQICLKLLAEIFPKYNMWDPGLVYHKEKDIIMQKEQGVFGEYIQNQELQEPTSDVYDLVGVSDLPFQDGAKRYIEGCINEYIEYFMFKDTDVLDEEITEVLNTLHKLDPYQSTISRFTIEKIDMDRIIYQILLPYTNSHNRTQLHIGLFHNDYYIIHDSEYIDKDNSKRDCKCVIKTKYDEILNFLTQLLDMRIKENNSLFIGA